MPVLGNDLIVAKAGGVPPEPDPTLFYNNSAETQLYYTDDANTEPLANEGGGAAFGPLTTSYVAAVEANGGTIDEAKQQLVDDFFYAEYANASAGTGTVNSFIDAFNGADTAIFLFFGDNLPAALVPAVGRGLTPVTNVGFIEADYSPTLGLQGDGTSYLVTNINLANLNPTSITVLTAVRLDGAVSKNYVFSLSGVDQIRSGTLFNGNYYIRVLSSSASTVITSPPAELIATLNSTPTEQRIFNGLTSVATSAAVAGSFVTTDLRVGHTSGSFTGDFNVLAISSRLLTNDERTILHNAVQAFVTARQLL